MRRTSGSCRSTILLLVVTMMSESGTLRPPAPDSGAASFEAAHPLPAGRAGSAAAGSSPVVSSSAGAAGEAAAPAAAADVSAASVSLEGPQSRPSALRSDSAAAAATGGAGTAFSSAGRPLSLIHISEPTRLGMISYAVFCLKKKKKNKQNTNY